MEIIEREGRYFVQCSDGEFEITREELQQSAEVADRLIRHSETWLKMYEGNGWTIATTPKDAELHVNLTMLFEDLERFFEEKYHAGESLWTAYRQCDVAIFEANKSLLNPYGNAERDKAWLARWQAMKGFLDLLPKRGAFDETPPFPIPAPAPSGPQPEATVAVGALTAASPWAPLLEGLKIEELFSLFADCGLLTKVGELTSLGRGEGLRKARKAPWAGTLQALMQAGLLDTCAAAVCRALADPAGGVQVSLNEGTLRDCSKKADTYLTAANRVLGEHGLLRK